MQQHALSRPLRSGNHVGGLARRRLVPSCAPKPGRLTGGPRPRTGSVAPRALGAAAAGAAARDGQVTAALPASAPPAAADAPVRMPASTATTGSASAAQAARAAAAAALAHERYQHAWWPAGASHLSCDIGPQMGVLELHGNYTMYGPAVVERAADAAPALLVRLLPGGRAEQATTFRAEPSGRCHQAVVASGTSMGSTMGSSLDDGSSLLSLDDGGSSPLGGSVLGSGSLDGGGGGGAAAASGQRACGALLLYASLVQLAGGFSVAADGVSGRAARRHAGTGVVLHVAELAPGGEVFLAPGGKLMHPVSAHPVSEDEGTYD